MDPRPVPIDQLECPQCGEMVPLVAGEVACSMCGHKVGINRQPEPRVASDVSALGLGVLAFVIGLILLTVMMCGGLAGR